jgi:hypothetical protein
VKPACSACCVLGVRCRFCVNTSAAGGGGGGDEVADLSGGGRARGGARSAAANPRGGADLTRMAAAPRARRIPHKLAAPTERPRGRARDAHGADLAAEWGR